MTIHDLGDVRRQAMTAGWADAGFAVYVHWPFCAAKCPYCDFNSHVRHQPIDEARYVAAFRRSIRRSCPKAWCSFGVRRALRTEPEMDQLAAGRLMRGSSLIVAMVSRVI